MIQISISDNKQEKLSHYKTCKNAEVFNEI